MNHQQATLPPEVLVAVHDFDRAWGGHTAWDIGERLTCSESDAFADLLAALGMPDQAESLRRGHAESDTDEDEHYIEPTEDKHG